MKKLLLILLCVPLIGMGQWSDYYKIDAKIKKDVNVSGNITHNHNITTIDYINAITKLLPYAIGKKKTIEDTEETEPISILINIDGQEIE